PASLYSAHSILDTFSFTRSGHLPHFTSFPTRRSSDLELDLAAINATHPASTIAHLLKYDTTHGTWDKTVEVKGDNLVVDGKEITVTSDRNPENLPWKDLGIDLVIEATGAFNHGDKAAAHINAGAKKVLITRS